jgi:hypothetical protein
MYAVLIVLFVHAALAADASAVAKQLIPSGVDDPAEQQHVVTPMDALRGRRLILEDDLSDKCSSVTFVDTPCKACEQGNDQPIVAFRDSSGNQFDWCPLSAGGFEVPLCVNGLTLRDLGLADDPETYCSIKADYSISVFGLSTTRQSITPNGQAIRMCDCSKWPVGIIA